MEKTKTGRVDPEQLEKEREKAERERMKANKDANPDPITGAPGSHPVGTGTGAAAGAAAGAAIGTAVGGPVGMAVGGVVGAVGGGLAGKAAAEAVNPTEESAYWRENYKSRPYVDTSVDYSVYEPAYRYGWEAYSRYPDRSWTDVESDLSTGWTTARGTSYLEWKDAQAAARDAWTRVETSRRTEVTTDTE